MAKVTYNDMDGSAPEVVVHGMTLQDGKAVSTDDMPGVDTAALLRMARGNPWFDVSDDDTEEPEQDTPHERGAKAAEAGKKRSIPVSYRGKVEGDAWLAGFDSYRPEGA